MMLRQPPHGLGEQTGARQDKAGNAGKVRRTVRR
jgi:hypothetical protein